MIKLTLPKLSGLKKEGRPAPPTAEYAGCTREVPYAAGVPATSRLQCADICKHTGNCQRERELLK